VRAPHRPGARLQPSCTSDSETGRDKNEGSASVSESETSGRPRSGEHGTLSDETQTELSDTPTLAPTNNSKLYVLVSVRESRAGLPRSVHCEETLCV
jgi:hypothetical protein